MFASFQMFGSRSPASPPGVCAPSSSLCGGRRLKFLSVVTDPFPSSIFTINHLVIRHALLFPVCPA